MEMTIAALRAHYASGALRPQDVLTEIRRRIDEHAPYNAWLHVLSENALQPYLDKLEHMDPEDSPLWGIPFAIKDNIDLAGCPTTAACPDFSYVPEQSATVVAKLIGAGALPIGKTNLDQFATGLVGTRSPHGPTRNAIDPKMISGGSSAGSAVALKLGHCCFSLGTDTAGSGRVPAALNGLVGFKPTRGWLSTSGVVPACRTLDCVSVFAHSVADARDVLNVAGGFDSADTYSRRLQFAGFDANKPRYGMLNEQSLEACHFAYKDAYDSWMAELPAVRVCDTSFLLDAAALLYQGPWLSERYAALSEFMAEHRDSVYPTTRSIIENGAAFSAESAFKGQYQLAALRRRAETLFESIDVLVVPSVPAAYTIAQVEKEPIDTNAHLGTYTNFVNLLDLCAVAIPAEAQVHGLPFGVTLIAPAGRDHALLDLAASMLGSGPAASLESADLLPEARPGEFHLAVCGAHLDGQPLNSQLTERGGYLLWEGSTSPDYRLYALPDNKRPAMIRDAQQGQAIEVEVWSIDSAAVGSFLRGVAPPLGLGSVELSNGAWVNGFIAEPVATEGAAEVTHLGGWRSHLAARSRS
ncbi:MAG: allophanate hydrolase [Pseudomonadales bacterium]